MPKLHKKLALALVVQATLLSTAYASEQSDSKGFVEDSKGSILLRNGWINRDFTTNGTYKSSWGQGVIGKFDSGFTQGTVGFGVGALGDFAFKLGDNSHAGNQMLYKDGQKDIWARGGVNVKARISNTTVVYGTQFLQLPVLASNDLRLLPEYYTGTLVTSHEIKDLEVVYGHFTKDQYSNQINTDGNHLKRADVWGAKYQFTKDLQGSYYGAAFKNALQRHYLDLNYKLPLAADRSLTFDLNGYHTKYDANLDSDNSKERILSFPTGAYNTEKKNNIWAVAATYNQGPHTGMLSYQQSTGNVGYDYNIVGDGGGSIALPNSYFSDFNGNHEKSLQAMYSLDFGALGVPGLTWTTAYVYGWNIHVQDKTDNAKEREIFNQVKYTVQNGFAKDLSFKVRNSTYRANASYNDYAGNTNEWRLYLEYPINF
ncbi:hypothetical protein P256_01963 [Acinetobacter nectaris CIP 110549]|uniref:Outer membrane porin, OprD family n=1 Tax=Acinetobacter nectaris CIP 110549 TaxID=1392540 RepID=V2USV7_9GAMM|nr:OprD family outer membrane porin [Acinetobacter nectaris]ESK38424.1 hypothetical protein P256_01963 [Acinetobacter nectaris CIP 110549]